MRTEPRKKKKKEQKRLIKDHPSISLLQLEKEMNSGWVDKPLYIGGLTWSDQGRDHWKRMRKLTEQN